MSDPSLTCPRCGCHILSPETPAWKGCGLCHGKPIPEIIMIGYALLCANTPDVPPAIDDVSQMKIDLLYDKKS